MRVPDNIDQDVQELQQIQWLSLTGVAHTTYMHVGLQVNDQLFCITCLRHMSMAYVYCRIGAHV